MSTSKPWLLSTSKDLANDKRESDQYRTEYNTNKFPGVKSSIEKKVEWVKKVEAMYEDIMEECFYLASAPDPISYCKDVLFEKCPNEVRVEFLVNVEQLKEVTKDMTPENEAKIVDRVYSFIPRYEREKVGEGSSWENIFRCLTSLVTQGFFSKGEVMIASKKIKKNDNVIDEMNKVCKELGIEDHIQGGQGGTEENGFYSWSIDDVFGRNMYSNDAIGVYWRMYLKFNKNAEMTDEEKAVAEYRLLLGKKKAESASSDNPKVFLLMKRKGMQKEDNDGDDDSDDDSGEEEEEEEERRRRRNSCHP